MDLRVGGEETLDLLQTDRAGTDHEAGATAEVQAGHVEGLLEHLGVARGIATIEGKFADTGSRRHTEILSRLPR